MEFKHFLFLVLVTFFTSTIATAGHGYECEMKVDQMGNTLVRNVTVADLYKLHGEKLGGYVFRVRNSAYFGFVFVEFIDERFATAAEDYSALASTSTSLVVSRLFNRAMDEHISLICKRT